MKYRSSFEIIALILETVKHGDVGQYAIITQTGISHLQFKKYLESLAEIGFIETIQEKDRVFYRTSVKGRDFLDQYYVLLEMLSNTQISSNRASIPMMLENRAESRDHSTKGASMHWMR
jgi:predicted transcriptional regulator